MKQFFIRSVVFLIGTACACQCLAQEGDVRPKYISSDLTTRRPAASAPIRLPPIEVLMFESAATSTPFLFAPIANLQLDEFQTAPAVKLGIGQPTGEKLSIGGWISFGDAGVSQ